jgi:hypothetical protein
MKVGFSIMAPVTGLEPVTTRLTVECATIAPHRNGILKGSLVILYFSVRQLTGPYFIRAAHGPEPFSEMPSSFLFFPERAEN